MASARRGYIHPPRAPVRLDFSSWKRPQTIRYVLQAEQAVPTYFNITIAVRLSDILMRSRAPGLRELEVAHLGSWFSMNVMRIDWRILRHNVPRFRVSVPIAWKYLLSWQSQVTRLLHSPKALRFSQRCPSVMARAQAVNEWNRIRKTKNTTDTIECCTRFVVE